MRLPTAARLLLAVLVFVGAAVLTASGRWPWRRIQDASVSVRSGLPFVPERLTSADTLRSGETLGELFQRQGLIPDELIAVVQRAGLDMRRLRAGLVVQFGRQAGDPAPSEVRMRVSPTLRLAAWREDAVARLSALGARQDDSLDGQLGGWTAVTQPVTWRREIVRLEGPIASSLYDALHARIPDQVLDAEQRVRLAWDIADIYAWSVDFNVDIQPGDAFTVLVEREISDEGEVRAGRTLAADLLVSGKRLQAFRFDLPDDGARYFDADGNSLRRAFLRAPVAFRRISSGFSRSRYHPILGRWRRHQGTDYAADRGTPVMAAGDGTVLRAGWQGGYGRMVELRHLNGITTRYGHLSGFASGVRAGTRIRQGEVIGYVGSTGLASGPHLHYEFRVHGVARDARRVNVGRGDPIPAVLRAQFAAERARLAEALQGNPVGSIVNAGG
ncbi:MAG: M23 family metallopeptidase [Gemmatimonadales bacterium]